ncbi:MAG: YfcC family protein, partial [Firmicutes bacterium]|nr:YfcC family protein [Bacillota bacterium]
MKKKIQMPSALMIVTIFLFIVGLLTWFVPTSVVVDGEIIFNAAFDADGNVIENAGTSPVGLWDFFLAPILGLQEGVQVAAALIVSGGFVAVLNKTGALDAGIGALLRRFSGNTLICVLMFAFALMGTVYGLWEELPAYAIVVIPMFLAAGYDAFTGIMVIIVGAVAGNMADIVNPYAIGAAVAAIGDETLGIGDGIVLRMILFVVLLVMGCFFVTRYANTVKKNPAKSVVDNPEAASLHASFDVEEIKPLTGRHKASLIIFGLVIIVTIVGYAP